MILYQKYQGTSEKTKGKWYARARIDETIDLDKLAEHMANHNTPYSKGAIKGVLTDMVVCIKELLLEGKQVKLPDLGIFSPRIRCTGASSSKEFSVKANVTSVGVRCRGTGELTNRTITAEASLREYGSYTSPTETTT